MKIDRNARERATRLGTGLGALAALIAVLAIAMFAQMGPHQ